MNVGIPKNFEMLIENFKGDIYAAMPNFLETEENGTCSMNLILERKGIKCLSLNNIGSQMILLFLVFFVKITLVCLNFLTRILNKIIFSKDSSFTITNWLNKKVSLPLIMLLISGMQLELFLGAWPNFKINKIETFTELFSMFITITILLGNTFFIFMVIRAYFEYFKLIQNKKIEKNYKEMYQKKHPTLLKIFDGLKDDTSITVWLIGIRSLKDMVVPLTLVYGI